MSYFSKVLFVLEFPLYDVHILIVSLGTLHIRIPAIYFRYDLTINRTLTPAGPICSNTLIFIIESCTSHVMSRLSDHSVFGFQDGLIVRIQDAINACELS